MTIGSHSPHFTFFFGLQIPRPCHLTSHSLLLIYCLTPSGKTSITIDKGCLWARGSHFIVSMLRPRVSLLIRSYHSTPFISLFQYLDPVLTNPDDREFKVLVCKTLTLSTISYHPRAAKCTLPYPHTYVQHRHTTLIASPSSHSDFTHNRPASLSEVHGTTNGIRTWHTVYADESPVPDPCPGVGLEESTHAD